MSNKTSKAAPEAQPAPASPDSKVGDWAVRIQPAPRRVFLGVTQEVAIAMYRQRYQICRQDLPVQIEEANVNGVERRPVTAGAR